MLTLLLPALAAFLLCLLVTPVVRATALRLGVTDRPDQHRKLHREAIPLGGGLAVLLASGAVLLGISWLPQFRSWIDDSSHSQLGLLTAAGLIVLIGLYDDCFVLRGRYKLLGQLLVAGLLVQGGLLIRTIALFEVTIELGWMAVPFTLFWLMGAMNSLNLIDGLDGLATSVGMILSLALGFMAALNGQTSEAVVAIALAGALAGFLCFNFPPAKMFLGDSGSMLIGLVVGAVAIRASLKGPATVAMAAPIALLAIPIFDSTAAILRRKLTGRSVYATDRAHLHHVLSSRLGGKTALAAIAALCIFTSAGALVGVYLKSDLFALISMSCIVSIMIATRIFGHVEAQLLFRRMRGAILRIFQRQHGYGPLLSSSGVRLQGSRQWELLWETLTEFADKLRLQSLSLDVNLPAQQEGYFATWNRPLSSDERPLWKTEVPLFVGELFIGRLSITGEHDGRSVCELIGQLMEVVQPFEKRLADLLREPTEPEVLDPEEAPAVVV